MQKSFSVLMGMRINIPDHYKEREDEFVPMVLNAIQKNATGFWDSETRTTMALADIFTRDWDFTTTAAEMNEREHWVHDTN